MPLQRCPIQKSSSSRAFRGKALHPIAHLCSVLLVASFVTLKPQLAEAIERRDVSGELHWTSAALQGSAGQGALSEAWVDQAQTDVSLLARRKNNVEFSIFSSSVVISRDVSDALQKLVKSFATEKSTTSSGGQAETTARALDEVRSVFGKTMTTQAHAHLLSLRIGRVGVVPYVTGALDAVIDNSAWPKLDSYMGGYTGVLVSYAQEINKDFDIGVALRPGVGGYRKYALDLSLLGDFITSDGGSGASSTESMFAFPVAMYLPLDLAVGWWAGSSTRFHLVSRNTFDAVPLSNISGTPTVLQNRINLGFSQQIPLSGSKLQTVHVAGELQDVAGLRGGWNDLLLRMQWAGRYAVRLPVRDQTSFAINAGLHSGYPVVSLYLDMFLFKFEVALSARENGAYPGQRANRLQTISINSQMRF